MRKSLYYIIEEDGRSRQIVNGVVTSLNQKKPLSYSPVGWQDILILWERNISRWAQVRNFSLPMGFVRDGAMILRHDMYMWNIDRKLYLLIQKFASTIDAVNFTDRYEFLYKGELDFSTFEDVPGEMRVNINILEGGLSKLVKANESTQFLIPFDSDAIHIEMTGVFLYQNATYAIIPVEQRSTGFAGSIWKDLSTIPFSLITNEGSASGIALFTQNQEQIDGSVTKEEYMASSSNYFAINKSSETINVRLQGTLKFYCETKTGTVSYYADFNKQDGTAYSIFDNVTLVEDQTFEEDFDITIPLGPDEKLFLLNFFDNSGGGTNLAKIIFQETPLVTVDYKSKKETSIIKAFRPISLYKKLCAKLEIQESKAISTLLEASTIMITSGDGIRGINASDVGVKTSINDFFKAFDVYEMLGMSIKETINIERREDFFSTSNPVALGEVVDFKTTPATDLMYSSIKVGHKEQDIEDLNGKYDFNGYMIFTTPVKRGGGKEMDLVSPYKAGPYEIESIRAGYDGKATTDSDRDNQVFAIACNNPETEISTTVDFIATGNKMNFPSGVKLLAGMTVNITGSTLNDRSYSIQDVADEITQQVATLDVAVADESAVTVTITVLSGNVYALDRSITVTEGVPDPATIFNVPLSPKRLLQKHYRWIRSFLYNYDPGKIVFQQANRNADLIAGGITEKSDVEIGNMGAILFKPFYHEFKTKVPVDLVETLDTTPRAPFMPTWLGDDYTGFLWRAGISPNSDTPQVFKILSGPDNDLTRLIA